MLFISLQNITLPEWTTLNMISPILGSILAILFLGEKINYFTTTAIFLGFIIPFLSTETNETSIKFV
mgnify:CR=1 FL=1